MYAIIETGGKQVRVEVGAKIFVEKLDAEVGSTVTLDKVLLVCDKKQKSEPHMSKVQTLLLKSRNKVNPRKSVFSPIRIRLTKDAL